MRRAGVAQSGQGALVWVDCTRRVICAAVSSTSQASRCSVVASGTKRDKKRESGVETTIRYGHIAEFEDGMWTRLTGYATWEEALEAAGVTALEGGHDPR